MKNFLLTLAGAILLFAFSCKNVDDELVGKIQNDITTLQTNYANYEASGKPLLDLIAKMDAATEGFKKTNRFVELYENNTRIRQKQDATLAEAKDIATKLQTLMADYEAGKIKTEAVQAEYQATLGTATNNDARYKQVFETIGNLVAANSETYTKMEAEYTANPSSFGIFNEGLMARPNPALGGGVGASGPIPSGGADTDSPSAGAPAAGAPAAGAGGLRPGNGTGAGNGTLQPQMPRKGDPNNPPTTVTGGTQQRKQ